MKELIKIANILDELGLHSDADKIDEVLEEESCSEDSYMFKPQVSSSVKRLQKILSELEDKGERKLPDWMETYMATISDRVSAVYDAFFEGRV